MGRKKAVRLPFTKAKIKSDTIFSLFALLELFAFGVLLISFYQEATALSSLRSWLVLSFGSIAMLFPFLLLMAAGVTVQSKKLRIVKGRWFVGYSLLFISLLMLMRAGSMGGYFFDTASTFISPFGTYLAALILLSAAVLIAFELSIHDALLLIKNMFVYVGKLFGGLFARSEKGKADKKHDKEFVGEEEDDDDALPAVKPVIAPKAGMPAVKMSNEAMFNSSATGVAKDWKYPPLSLLDNPTNTEADRGDVKKNSDNIEEALESFGIRARVADINFGPAVTQYALQIAKGVNVNKITSLSNNLALALAAPNGQIRIEAPIPGKALVGIEVPNLRPQLVTLKQMLTTADFSDHQKLLRVPMGLNVSGEPVSIDLDKMPHILVAGTTGSGKSICLSSWICTLLYRTTPDDVKLMLIDPKRVTFSMFDGIPHLLTNIITDQKDTLKALKWAVKTMEERYKELQAAKCTDIYSYNAQNTDPAKRMPMIVIMIDELADLMMYASKEVEDAITRIAQMARAVGLYLVLATQRPSVDVITGLMKANIPARVAFNVSSMIDSRVIIDTPGAEKLLGKGDMLFISPTQSKPVRIQAPFVSEREMKALVEYFKKMVPEVHYTTEVTENDDVRVMVDSKGQMSLKTEEVDPLFEDAVRLVLEHKKASASFFQRFLSIGYSRAARLLDSLQAAGVVGPQQGAKPREILIHSIDELHTS